MKDIQGVFWGSPRIEALFWPGLEGYVTALTGRALDWQSRGQRFDPAILHQEKPWNHSGTDLVIGMEGAALYASSPNALEVLLGEALAKTWANRYNKNTDIVL